MRWEKQLLVWGIIAFFVLGGVIGCAKKQEVGELTPSSEETTTTVVELGSPSTTTASNAVVPATAPISASPATASFAAVTPLPQDALQRTRTIQLALKQAGFYSGSIDGKTGPLTQKAVEDFQKAKGLKEDGKVGAITWAELGKYLPQEAKSQ